MSKIWNNVDFDKWIENGCKEEEAISVHILNLANGNRNELPYNIFIFKNLVELNLSHNPLHKIPDSLSDLRLHKLFVDDISENSVIIEPNKESFYILRRFPGDVEDKLTKIIKKD